MSRALGRYELLRPLARGGMAEVFLARRRAAGVEKVLVVKRIRPERANDVEFLDLFVREARLSMSLAHQNIVPVFDFGRAGDQVYFAMERVEGKDLGSSITRAGARRMPPVIAAFVAAECCQALDYAHHRERDGERLGIVHRDVTPRNVLISWSGEVKLTDFGIASLAGDEKARLIGTPAYMAPEQARKQAVDARADIYAVGLVLREALTGQRARPGGDREALLAAAGRGELAPWPDGPDGPDGIDPALVAIVDRATARAPEDRYPDARSMLAELDEYIVGARAAQRGEPPARQLASWLASVWEGARDETTAGESAPDMNLVSLFDIGTGTQRSLMATATDDPQSLPSPAPAPRARWPYVAAVAATAAIAGVLLVRRQGAPDASSIDLVREGVVEPEVQNVVSQREEPPPPPPAAPAVEEPPAPAPAPTPPVRRVVTPPPPARPPPAPAVQLVEVIVGSDPWAYFTIDDDPTKHQTVERLRLAPGPHRFHFWNELQKLDKTTTVEITGDGQRVFEKFQ